MEKKYCTAVVLAGGSGKRMGTKVHKQYLMLKGYPVLYYSLKAFQDSSWIDEIVLVSGTGEEEYCQKEIVEKYDQLPQNRRTKGIISFWIYSIVSIPLFFILVAILAR